MDNPFVEQAEFLFFQEACDEALRVARMGLVLFPQHPGLLEIAANCAEALGEGEHAVDFWHRLLSVNPCVANVRNRLALRLEALDRGEEAEAIYREGLAVCPEDASLHSNLGLLLENAGRVEEAETCQRIALRQAPDSAEIHSNLAGVLLKRGLEVEAEQAYRRALELRPDFASAHSNLGVLLAESARETEAEACFRRALALQPDNLQTQTNLGELLLRQGRLEEGWALYESRKIVFGKAPDAAFPCPEWRGELLAGKSIVVLSEQGLGDEIQFVRYLAWLKAQEPDCVTLLCRPCQLSLLKTLAGPDCVCSLEQAEEVLPAHDYWVFLMSLPYLAGTTLATIPATVPYLFPDARRQAVFRPELEGEGLRVGVVWRGNPGHLNDSERSLPGLEVLAPLWAVAGVRFFCVQKRDVGAPVLAGQELTDFSRRIGDFADTAAIVSQLDLLVSVDTSVAHLAGALGVRCWVLLPRFKTDWRWLRERCDSPWYPSLRLFRQVERGDWSDPVREMQAALRQLAGKS